MEYEEDISRETAGLDSKSLHWLKIALPFRISFASISNGKVETYVLKVPSSAAFSKPSCIVPLSWTYAELSERATGNWPTRVLDCHREESERIWGGGPPGQKQRQKDIFWVTVRHKETFGRHFARTWDRWVCISGIYSFSQVWGTKGLLSAKYIWKRASE